MIRRFRFPTLLALAVALIALGIVSSGSAVNVAEAGNGPGDIVPGRYIVVLENGASPGDMARSHGLAPTHVYRHALNGFAATIPSGRLVAIENDPRVAFVEPDRAYTVADQTTPTGIDRIEADRNPKAHGVVVDLDVAIIDTGINAHEDLRLAGGVNFAGGSSTKFSDGYGHGTHVAGTVGALDNDLGVVGVAPGARVWAVRVCNNGGICFRSDIIAGIGWVIERKLEAHGGDADPGIDFAVANMSLGTGNNDTPCEEFSADALRNAVCELVGSGVPLALAAGNESTTKVAYDAAIAVSAIADFDGKGGGAAAPACDDEDDTLANFSNFGPTIDIAAPGVCILSTSSSGGYALGSGTSMATPHVAGAVALYLHANDLSPATDGVGVDVIEEAITDAALLQSHKCGYTNEHAGDGSDEPLLFVNASAFGGNDLCDTASADPTHDIAVTAISASPNPAAQGDTVDVSVTVENLGNQDVNSNINVTLTDNTDVATIGIPQIISGLDAGASINLTFFWNTTAASLGNHTLTASHDFTDDDPSNDSLTTVVTVGQDEENGGGPPCAKNPDHPRCR